MIQTGKVSGRWKHAAVFCLIGMTILFFGACKKEEVKTPPPPPEVYVITVEPRSVPVKVGFVAQVESSHQVEIVARVSGFLEKILYQEGKVVQEGETMFLMDQRPFQAQVDAETAALENYQAQLWTAQTNLDRVRPLAELDAASKSDLDNATGAVKAAKAAVSQAQARLDQAKLNYSYTMIKAPVTGVSGEALIREGAYLSAETGADLTYVARLDPIWVNFSISQNQMTEFQTQAKQGLLVLPPDSQFGVTVDLSNDIPYPHTGKLNFIDPTFNPDTDTFMVRAIIPNPDNELRPGMFVTATVTGAHRPNALLVPQRAVQQSSNGHVIFLVKSDGTAEVRPVTVGQWVDEDWIIEKGLQAGEQVITDGFQRLAPGMKVKALVAPPKTSSPKTTATAAPAATK
jgi:membrane fusion protein (multidrug efflux system)